MLDIHHILGTRIDIADARSNATFKLCARPTQQPERIQQLHAAGEDVSMHASVRTMFVLSSFNGDQKTINITLLLESAVSVLSGDNQLSAGDERPLKRARLNAPTVSDDQHVEAQQTVPPLASLLRVRRLPEQFSRCNSGQIWPTCALHQL